MFYDLYKKIRFRVGFHGCTHVSTWGLDHGVVIINN
jgi:hypothetical protein